VRLKLRFVGIVAVALTCLVSATVAGTASASQDVNVTAQLYEPNGVTSTDTATIGQLEAQSCPTTAVPVPPQYLPNGILSPATGGPSDGTDEWALATVLSDPHCLPTPIPINTITEVVMVNGSTRQAPLTPADLTLPSDFQDPNTWPIFWDSGTVIYVRPTRNSATDANAGDQIQVNPQGTLLMDVYVGVTPQQLTVTASPTTAKKNSPVTFSVQGVPPGETYDWSFDGAAPDSSAASPTVRFPEDGVWDVTLQVTGSIYGYGSLQVTIGSPKPQTGTKTIKTGPAKSKGKTPGGSPGAKKKVTPVATPKAKPKPTPTPTPKPKPKAKPKPKPKPKPKKPAKKKQHTTTSATAVAPPSTPSSGGTGGGSGAGTTPGAGATKTPVTPPTSPVHVKVVTKHHHPTISPKPPATPKRHGTLVSGRSLGAIEPLSGSAQKLAQDLTPTNSAPPLSEPSGPGPWALIGAIAAILVILGLGAGSERRHVRSVP
jgi:hypothetical protein